MNNYHLIEEIGKGKYSTVYKGRKKHTIHYVVVKSIEKHRREKVMTEVGILSQLDHTNVVSFVSWYETRNHLWIIYEYCAGGNLLNLLQQDVRLPEEQVRRFGSDVCAGLLHVHKHSVIYCDLKPANLLLNEDGTIKLSDFGHSQRLVDIEQSVLDQVPLARRGTPHYMAPELLHDGGMHSFASDIWALGCVLYEMLVGRPPFQSTSLQELQHVVTNDTAPLRGVGSTELQGLLMALLHKNPLGRADWITLRSSAFWYGEAPGDETEAESLPWQPHLEHLRDVWARIELVRSPSRSVPGIEVKGARERAYSSGYNRTSPDGYQ